MTEPRIETAVVGTSLEYQLNDIEAAELAELLDEMQASAGDPSRGDFYDRYWSYCDRIPAGLRRALNWFRRTEATASVVIRGLPLDEASVGPTPCHWRHAADGASTLRHELTLGLCGLVLGDPFTWGTLQQGRLIQNVLPIPGDETLQNGHGSEAFLEFHTEDGFHPRRCDYLLLLGVRNPDRVPTVLSSVRDIDLGAHYRRVLSEARFYIRPDDEHIRQLAALGVDHPALAKALQMSERPVPVPVLFGNPDFPYLRIDPPFMRCDASDYEAREALDALVARLQERTASVIVDSGTLLIVDNYQAVHGRSAFKARYDGTDRWLKKLVVSRDLRASGQDGPCDGTRVLF